MRRALEGEERKRRQGRRVPRPRMSELRRARASQRAGAAALDPLGSPDEGRGGQPGGAGRAAVLGGRSGGCLSVGGGRGTSREPLVLGASLGRLVLGLDELAGAGVGQDEASGQAGVKDHDEQDVEIGVVALGAGHLAAHEGVGHDPHAHARAGAGAQAAGIAPVVQLEQQAAQQGPQPLALAAVHSCRGVTRRLQIAADLAPGPGRGDAGERRRLHPAPGRATQWLGDPAARASLSPHPGASSPSPPRPLGPKPPLPRLRLSRRPGERGQLVGGGEGDEGGGEAGRGAEGAGARGMRGAPGGRGWQGGSLGPSVDPGLRKRIPSTFWPPALQAQLWPRYSIWPPRGGSCTGVPSALTKRQPRPRVHISGRVITPMDKNPGLSFQPSRLPLDRGEHLIQKMLRTHLVTEVE